MSRLFCGVDFHKRTCTLFVVNEKGVAQGLAKQVTTERLLEELLQLRNCVVGIESSGGVNHVVQKIKAQGIDARIINSNRARAIGYGGKKTDAKDAEMIAHLLRTDFAPEVAHRSKSARDMSLLITAREHLVSLRTQTICHIRGLLREYGLVMEAGVDAFYREAAKNIERLQELNPILSRVLAKSLETVLKLKAEEQEINATIERQTDEDKRIERLRTIPGIGPLNSFLMVAVVDDISRFKSSSSFASYLGLVPRESSSGDTRRLGSVTKAGNDTLRRYLIHGARAVLSGKQYENDPLYKWAKKLEAKKGTNKATVALAHKLARVCFAVLRDDKEYSRTGKPLHEKRKNIQEEKIAV